MSAAETLDSEPVTTAPPSSHTWSGSSMARSALRYARGHLGRPAVPRRLELVVDAARTGRSEEVGR